MREEKEKLYVFDLPTNFDEDVGYLGGVVKKRNLIEAGIVLFLMWQLINPFLESMDIAVLLFILILVVLPIGGLFLIGIGGLPISIFVKEVFLHLTSMKRSNMRYEHIVDKYSDDEDEDEDDEVDEEVIERYRVH